MRILKGHRNTVTCLVLTNNRRFLYSASYDKTIRVWDVNSGKLMLTIRGHRAAVKSFVLTGNNSQIFSGKFFLYKIVLGNVLRL